jgi:CheY-like chemotaxis protein
VTTLRTIIVDDEAPARELLRSMLKAWPECAIVGEAGDGESAVTMIRHLSPDLLFLDVQMSGLDGFDVVASVAPSTGGTSSSTPTRSTGWRRTTKSSASTLARPCSS